MKRTFDSLVCDIPTKASKVCSLSTGKNSDANNTSKQQLVASSSRSSSSSSSSRIKLMDINQSICCRLCGGYLIDATSLADCCHSFCRSCILKHLKSNPYCPSCKGTRQKIKPSNGLMLDHNLQTIVYKLVPHLHSTEMARRRSFYAENPEVVAELSAEERGETRGAPRPEDKISVVLEYGYMQKVSQDEASSENVPLNTSTSTSGPSKTGSQLATTEGKQQATEASIDEGKLNSEMTNSRRYLLCMAGMPVALLKKFIIKKYDLGVNYIVDVMYQDKVLEDKWTLVDVSYCHGHVEPIPLFYRVAQRVSQASSPNSSSSSNTVTISIEKPLASSMETPASCSSSSSSSSISTATGALALDASLPAKSTATTPKMASASTSTNTPMTVSKQCAPPKVTSAMDNTTAKSTSSGEKGTQIKEMPGKRANPNPSNSHGPIKRLHITPAGNGLSIFDGKSASKQPLTSHSKRVDLPLHSSSSSNSSNDAKSSSSSFTSTETLIVAKPPQSASPKSSNSTAISASLQCPVQKATSSSTTASSTSAVSSMASASKTTITPSLQRAAVKTPSNSNAISVSKQCPVQKCSEEKSSPKNLQENCKESSCVQKSVENVENEKGSVKQKIENERKETDLEREHKKEKPMKETQVATTTAASLVATAGKITPKHIASIEERNGLKLTNGLSNKQSQGPQSSKALISLHNSSSVASVVSSVSTSSTLTSTTRKSPPISPTIILSPDLMSPKPSSASAIASLFPAKGVNQLKEGPVKSNNQSSNTSNEASKTLQLIPIMNGLKANSELSGKQSQTSQSSKAISLHTSCSSSVSSSTSSSSSISKLSSPSPPKNDYQTPCKRPDKTRITTKSPSLNGINDSDTKYATTCSLVPVVCDINGKAKSIRTTVRTSIKETCSIPWNTCCQSLPLNLSKNPTNV